MLFSPGTTVDEADLPAGLGGPSPSVEERLFQGLPTLDEVERRYLLHVLEQVKGNRTRAAEVLGIDRRTLYRMAERFGLGLTGDARSLTTGGAYGPTDLIHPTASSNRRSKASPAPANAWFEAGITQRRFG